jgi:GTP-binding protein
MKIKNIENTKKQNIKPPLPISVPSENSVVSVVKKAKKHYLFKNAVFVKTAVHPKDFPVLKGDSGALLPEIAVAGRSNVGKSSLLNHLFQSPGLVKTSSTPGKTQALNFFKLNGALAFTDLPGYGYAEVPLQVRQSWGPMIQGYLKEREALKLILFLIDIRREPNDEDRQMVEWVAQNGKSMILVLTKIDKVKANEKEANTRKILKLLQAENIHYVHYSATKDVGRLKLIQMIGDALNCEMGEDDETSP